MHIKLHINVKSCTLCVNYTFSTGVPFCTHCKKSSQSKTASDASDKYEVYLKAACISDSVLLRRHELPGSGAPPQASASPMKRGSRRWIRWRWWRRWRRWKRLRWRPFAIPLTTGRCKSQLLWGQPKWMVVSSQAQSMWSASTKNIHCNDVRSGEG